MMMTKHLAVVLISNTEAHLVIIVLEHTGSHYWRSPLVKCRVIYGSVTVMLVLLYVCFASVSDMAGCRKRLCDDFKAVSRFKHQSKCAKVHRIVVSLSPMKDSSSGSVRILMASLLAGRHPAGFLRGSTQTAAAPRGILGEVRSCCPCEL